MAYRAPTRWTPASSASSTPTDRACAPTTDGRFQPSSGRRSRASRSTVAGDGRQTRSVCFVDDLVAGVLAVADSTLAGPVNVGNPDEMRVLDIARRIVDLTGSLSVVSHVDRPVDDPQVRRPDTQLITAALGWRPTVSFDEGISRTIAWFAALTAA